MRKHGTKDKVGKSKGDSGMLKKYMLMLFRKTGQGYSTTVNFK